MRRLLMVMLLPVCVVLALPLTPVGASPVRTTVTGKISALGRASVTVKGDLKVTCRVGTLSPRALGYVIGSGARITCVNGLLTKIVGTDRALPPIVDTTPRPAGTALSFTGVLGPITALSSTSITVGGLTCALGRASPDVSGYLAGDRVTASCSNGTLFAIRPTPAS